MSRRSSRNNIAPNSNETQPATPEQLANLRNSIQAVSAAVHWGKHFKDWDSQITDGRVTLRRRDSPSTSLTVYQDQATQEWTLERQIRRIDDNLDYDYSETWYTYVTPASEKSGRRIDRLCSQTGQFSIKPGEIRDERIYELPPISGMDAENLATDLVRFTDTAFTQAG